MRFRTTLIAALLLAGLGTYVYFFEIKKAEEEKKQEEEEKKVFSVDWDKVKGLSITNAHGTFLIEREAEAGTAEKEGEAATAKAESWRILEPLKTEADDMAINGLINNLKGVKVEKVVAESAGDLEPFGLAKPEIKVSVLAGEGESSPAPLLLGNKSPVGQNSYAMLEGSKGKVLLLSTHLVPQFDKTLYDLRRKKLFAFDRGDVVGLRILRSGEPEVEMTKEGDEWEILRPIRARASQTEVDKVLNKLTTLRAESFDDEKPKGLANYGLETPVWEIEAILKPDRTKATLLLGSIHEKEGKGYIYAKRAETPVVVSLNSELVSTFDKAPEDLREKKVLPFKTWEIQKAELDWKGQNVILEKRDGSKWWITAPVEARADGTRMSAFLGALSRLEGEAFLEKPQDKEGLAKVGLADPLARVVLYKEKPKVGEGEGQGAGEGVGEGGGEETGPSPVGVLLLGKGKGDGEGYYATLEGGDTLYRVKEAFYEEEFPENVDALRSKKVLDVSRYLVFGIDYDGPEGPVVLERSETDWKVKKPDSGPAEKKDVEALLTKLIDLEVVRYLKEVPDDLAALGLDPSAGRIVLSEEDGKELGALLFSDKGPQGEEGLIYVKARGEPWVGLLQEANKKSVLDALARFRPKD
jgi:hypothetical protein